jgi:CheY-like chemotaxis protein
VSKLYGTVQDISDRKTVEAKIAAASLAEAANLAKTEFLAVMSHELRTPMNAVIGMTDILLNTPLSPEQQGYVEMIQRGGEMLLSVISNILDFSRIESGEFELEERPLDLRQCIKEVLELMTFYKAEKILKLDALIGIDFPQQIMGDYARLRQILINLVSNAIKFTENGKVVIEASSQLLDQSTNTYELRFDVRDTGIGISDEQITKLFKAFSQADKSITRQYGGTGLGLVICKQLCELMGGNISVTSTVGVGSTFSFSIVGQAIVNNPEAIAPNLNDKKILSRLDQSFANQYPFRILVVEDNPVNQEILLLMLGKLGYTPQASSNGIEALTNLVEQSYDVIIIDIEMPIMDGLTASRKIRQLPNRTPWIVGLSANAFTESREIALAAGMNDYLTKPLQVEGLIAALERVTLSLTQENTCQESEHQALNL